VNTKSPITCHVLDTALGVPASGVAVELARASGAGWAPLAAALTDADGRVLGLLAPGQLEADTYRLSFATGAYFAAAGRPVFYPEVQVVFRVAAPTEHYHIPLLLSPFGYSTYRGS
jgi:5-hydroxyisourate hydrolase